MFHRENRSVIRLPKLLVLALTLVLVLSTMLPIFSNKVQAQNVTITFWQFSTDQISVDAWNQVIADFQKLNPGITIKMELVPWADQHTKLVTGLTTGALPDVSMLGNNVVAEFQALGALEPLTKYLDAWSKD